MSGNVWISNYGVKEQLGTEPTVWLGTAEAGTRGGSRTGTMVPRNSWGSSRSMYVHMSENSWNRNMVSRNGWGRGPEYVQEQLEQEPRCLGTAEGGATALMYLNRCLAGV
jgi:hypothetical protein